MWPRIKRIHEYKRHLLNILPPGLNLVGKEEFGSRFVIYRYMELKKKSPQERAQFQKRVVLIGGKAFRSSV